MSAPKRVLCQALPTPHHPTPLEESEATHATRVLRLKDGDVVEAMDGNGHAALTHLRTRNGPARLEFISSSVAGAPEQLVPVILEMAVLKGEAMEWVVEKAVELGVTTLAPVLTAHTVVQMDRKGPEAFRERWQKIADQALKQCGRLARLEVQAPCALEELVAKPVSARAQRIWCNEAERDGSQSLLDWLEKSRERDFSPLHLLVGPEGGWSAQERDLFSRESGLAQVSLGPLVLRAETAAIFATSLLAADFRLRRK